MYWYRARWYDPGQGRFVGQDPLGFAAGDTNLYRFVGNSPANYTDPTGMSAVTEEKVTQAKIVAPLAGSVRGFSSARSIVIGGIKLSGQIKGNIAPIAGEAALLFGFVGLAVAAPVAAILVSAKTGLPLGPGDSPELAAALLAHQAIQNQQSRIDLQAETSQAPQEPQCKIDDGPGTPGPYKELEGTDRIVIARGKKFTDRQIYALRSCPVLI